MTQMAFVPEYGDFVANSMHQTNELAEPIDGPIVTRYRELARQNSMWLSLGGFHIKALTLILRIPNPKPC